MSEEKKEQKRQERQQRTWYRLADVLMRPDSLKMTNAEIAREAGINAATLYRLKATPEFQEFLQVRTTSLYDEHLPKVIHALAESACMKGPLGHADRKLFLQVAGEYVPTENLNLSNLPDATLAAIAGRGGSRGGAEAAGQQSLFDAVGAADGSEPGGVG